MVYVANSNFYFASLDFLNFFEVFGPALLEHCLLEEEFTAGCKFGSEFIIERGWF